MSKIYPSKKLIILLVVFTFLMLPIFSNVDVFSKSMNSPPIPEGEEQDEGDGFWEIDNTFNETNVKLTNCTIDDSGEIRLNVNKGKGDNIDFSSGDDNEAYYFYKLIFIEAVPPIIYKILGKPIGSMWDIHKIKSEGDGSFSKGESAKGWVHYFRFKVDGDKEKISGLGIYWCGNAVNNSQVSIYCWQPFSKSVTSSFGRWEQVTNRTSNSPFIKLYYNVTGDLPIGDDNFIDICVAANPEFGKKCSLSTDYVKVSLYKEGFVTKGEAITLNPIRPKNISSWGLFTWEDYYEKNAAPIYHIYYDRNGTDELIEEKYLDGNGIGFKNKDKPVYLCNIPSNYTLKIKAELNADENTDVSPRISRLSMTWQTEKGIWKDLFNSTHALRIDTNTKNNVDIQNGKANLISSIYDWAMFGQNPANTRVSEGKGPDSPNPAWYYEPSNENYVGVGTGYRNPVQKDDKIFISSSDGGEIYAFDATPDMNDPPKKIDKPDDKANVPEFFIDNSPAIGKDSNDETIVIIATSETSNGGNKKNKVYAFNEYLSIKGNWGPFDYGKEICYSSSPIIADGKIFLSSWKGDESVWENFFESIIEGNNRLIALDLDNGELLWKKKLPAGSFCSPAVSKSDDIVIVGCENKNGPSLFAFDIEGNGEKWNVSTGPIGRASPVISNGKVFVTAKEDLSLGFWGIKIFAYELITGNELWNYSIEGTYAMTKYELIGCSSPVVHDDVVFITTPNSKLYAIKNGNLSEEWSSNPVNLYGGVLPPSSFLTSSPSYANDVIYIASSTGMYAINALNGKEIWSDKENNIVCSPIVTNGFVYYTNNEGKLFCVGEYQNVADPIEGSIKSTKIKIPDSQENFSWDKFSAHFNETNGEMTFKIFDKTGNKKLLDISDVKSGDIVSISAINEDNSADTPKTIRLYAEFTADNSPCDVSLNDWKVTFNYGPPSSKGPVFSNFNIDSEIPLICSIDVQDKEIGLSNTSAMYYLEYINVTNGIEKSEEYDNIIQCDFENGSKTKQNLIVNISSLTFLKDNDSDLELSKNITDLKIQFRIRNVNETSGKSEWHPLTESRDREKPIFYNDSFTPPKGWTSTTTPICTIDVQDRGTEGNITGLNVKSAKYTLEYKDQSGTKTPHTEAAQCSSGTNGTTTKVTLTADISKLDFSENITELQQIRFYIEDMAVNKNYSKWIEFKTDTEKPSSQITNTATIPNPCNTTPVTINATAEDDISGIRYVELYYQTSDNGEWSIFNPTDDTTPYSWGFSIGRDDGGEYELCTIATDNASNVEDYPSQGDVSFIFDPNDPYKPVFEDEYRFTNDTTIPEFSIEFKDDYKLKSVEYRLSFDGYNEWTKINDEDINSKSYTGNWNLTQNDWDYMLEDVDYYIYFRLTDSLKNQYKTSSDNEAMKIIKDLEINVNKTQYDPDLSDFYEWHWGNVYNIAVNANESNVTEIQLWYRYSSDNETWSNWTQYGDSLNASPFKWNFTAEEGNGHYEFKTKTWDAANQYHESAVKSTSITLFPTLPVITMIVFAIILITVSTVVLTKMKKKKTEKT